MQYVYELFRANFREVEDRLANMITLWTKVDVNASWTTLAVAMGKTPGYGDVTAAKLLQAAELHGNGQTVIKHFLYCKEVFIYFV